MGRLGFELEILADYLFDEIKKGERIFADETTLPTLAPGSGSTKTAWLWAYARDDRTFGGSGPPMVAYRFEDSRAGECVARHLKGYSGILQVDGYAAYNRLVRSDGGNDGVTLAGCWSHSRRKFYELHVSESSKVATETVERMAKLWQVEETIRNKALTPVSRRVSKSLRWLSPTSSLSGRRPCRGSPANRNWLRRFAMPSRVAPSSSAS